MSKYYSEQKGPSDPRQQLPEEHNSDWRIYLRLLSYVRPYLLFFVVSIFGYLVYSACNVLLAELMQYILDAIGDTEKVSSGIISGAVYALMGTEHGMTDRELARYAVPVLMILIAASRGLGFFVGGYFINHVARYVVHNLRCELFNKMLVAKSSYYDSHTSGALISKITFNVEQVTGAVTKALKIVLREGFSVVLLLSYLVYVNWRLCLVFLAVAPLIALVVAVVGKHFRRYSRRIQSSMGDVTQVSNESIGGYREVRMFGGKDQEAEKFRTASDYNRVQSMKLAFADAFSTPVIQIMVAVALAALVWFALSPSIMADFSAGQFAAFITAAGQLAKPIRQLSGIQNVIQRGLAAAEDIFSQLDEEGEPNEGTITLDRAKGRVEFNNVSFSYSEDSETVLDEISLSANPGETVALVGKSGSGKTTLMNLLCRLYSHTGGEILLDGVPVQDFDLDNLRQQISVVSQDVNLFHDSVEKNIAFGGLRHHSREEVVEAARAAHALSFIERLPEGMDTILGEDGGGLSGGQRQRIAIARAILKNAPVLILDEATSSLDNESEHRIQQALETVMTGRTTFVIAHRLTTVEKVNKIVVMDNGRVVDQGSHQQLLQSDGLYAQLFHQQFED
jgi:ATP-binding cassette, subfamily B, bacterial MsbA